jgi:macrolide transport system ATP-binding/permease protein
MSFLLLEARGLKKAFGGVDILDVKCFRVYAGDKIGFVGANGSGKSTLLSILSGELAPDEGIVTRYCETAYIRQFESNNHASKKNSAQDEGQQASVSQNDGWQASIAQGGSAHDAPYESALAHSLSIFGVQDKAGRDTVSGGEAARLRIAHALEGERRLVFADEPTSNLDYEGIARFGEALSQLESFILVSHDRDLLNRYCNKIVTLENMDIAEYEGGFDEYKQQSEARRERAQFEYERYTEEKRRLEGVYGEKKAKAAKVAKKPKGMSSSEQKQRDFIATSRSNDGRQRSFERAARNVQQRIDHLEVKERPEEAQRMKLDFSLTDPPSNKIILSGRGINFAYGPQILFEDASVEIPRGARVSLAGANGSGKTTLLNLIHQGHDNIYKVPKARLGYFYQGFENLDMNQSVLWNAMRDSVQREPVVRSVLARLLFGRTTVNKPAGVLSGGERIKLSLAKLLVSASNVLMLDEPTNYLDMPSIEVLQSIICEYEGTILFVSHDRAFTDAAATMKLVIEDKKILPVILMDAPKQDTMLRKHRVAELAGRITQASGEEKERLVREYMELAGTTP